MTGARGRAEVRYSGRVQGVGFRWRTVRTAEKFDVTGYVRNLRDGTVELVAEGSRPEVEGFLAAIAERLDGCIADADVTWNAPRGDRTSFGVVR